MTTVTVVVCTRNRPRELEACLAGLAAQTRLPDEVLVIDNGSTPPVADRCARWGARYAHEPWPGLCIARNTGARLASGEIVAYIDDDAVPEAEWMQRLLAGLADPSIAAVTGYYRYMKAREDGTRGMTEEEAPEARFRRPRMVIDRDTPNWFARACFGGVGDGSNMAFRRETLLGSPGFDNRLGRGRLIDGGDEQLLFMSLLAVGQRIAHVPEAVIRHPYPGTPEMARARLFRDRRTSIAFLIFLWFAFPGYRLDIARHLLGAVRKRLRVAGPNPSASASLTYREATHATVAGVALYLRARPELASIPAPDYGVVARSRLQAALMAKW